MAVHFALRFAALSSVLVFAIATDVFRGSSRLNEICEKNLHCTKPNSCIPIGNRNICRPRSSVGNPCNDVEDCKDKLRCINSVCAPAAKEGTPCGQYIKDEDCEAGFTCINKICSVKSVMGGPCDVFWNCKDDLVCIKKTCRVKSQHGGDCDSSIDCENSICALNSKTKEHKCDADFRSIFGSIVAFAFVIVTTGTLQFFAWRSHRK